ncbi:histidine phosphotransferase family protein [Paracoccus zhejiangensis]|uniref:Histidine phosphotransferase n=1 Tax=Paracoccus zhejiangensis TaxID=1077935 RepID=A0A2H5EX12_9RHOB|nr:histidine phosphotransferase family protein [Paracoccus zhejiangensis]AUH63813.1 histidine phosphotransferase [Paracoccus zhejiangensis]
MTDSSTRIEPLDLALLLGSRLCHDLVSPLGAISNGVELMQMGGAPMAVAQGPEMQLVADAVEAARARIQTFRMAFGRSGEEQRISGPELARLIRDMGAQGRLKIELDSDGDQPRREVQMLLLALMCLESAMPWGGRVLVVRSGTGWRLVGEADRTKPEPELWSWLDGSAPDLPHPPSAKVHFALLAEAIRASGRSLTWELDERGAEISF